MAKTPLQELADHGQSVWIDYLSRPFVQDGDLAGLVEQGVEGVTSNPTIFQGAIAEGDAYDEQIREIVEGGESEPEGDLHRARGAPTSATPATCCAASTTAATARTATSRSRSTRTSRTTREGTIEEAKRLHALIDKPNLFIKIPATQGGPARDRGDDRRRHPRQRDADLLARAPPRGRRGVRPRPPAARRLRRRPHQGRLRRLVLRLARRHGGRQAPRRARRPRRAQGQARDRQRQARLPDLQGGLLRRGVGGAGGQGRHGAALPVGVDLDQEPRVPRRDLRRGAHRPRHGQHDAARHGRGVDRPRRDPRTASRRTSRAPQAARRPQGRRHRLRRRRRDAREARAWRSSPTPSRSCSPTSSPSATSWWPHEPARDPTSAASSASSCGSTRSAAPPPPTPATRPPRCRPPT